MMTCPTCGGEGAMLGTLGMLTWFRCVNCGMEFNVEVLEPGDFEPEGPEPGTDEAAGWATERAITEARERGETSPWEE